jgi:hypothetical protein
MKLTALLLGLYAPLALGLECLPTTPKGSFGGAKLVYYGTVTDIPTETLEKTKVRVAVLETLKGPKQTTIDVSMNTSWDKFLGKKGEKFLVFGHQCEGSKEVCVGPCNLSPVGPAAEQMMKVVRPLAKATGK